MLSNKLTTALALLTTLVSASPLPAQDVNARSFEFVEAGSLDKPVNFLARLMPRTHERHCSNGVRVWGIRGSTAIHGDNPMASMAHEIAQWKPASFGSDLPYPAMTNADLATYFTQSVDVGVTMLTQRIQDYTTRCPGHPIALLGFSQGAEVLGDVLIGGDSDSAGLAAEYRGNIKAIVMFGDPAYTPGLPFDAGSPVSPTHGTIDRQNYQNYIDYGYAPYMKSFCDAGDMYCASATGPDAGAIHGAEPQTHWDDAIAFLKQMLA